MGQLEKWLQRHELASIAELLKSHDVTLDVLPDLTEQDLRELGLSLGVRRKFERAIRTDPPASPPVRSPHPEQTGAASAPDRRQLTVMFVDLVGSTALSRKLDPEDLRQIIRGYQNTVAGEIARYQGHIAQFLGDGVLCYFGWPVAYEFGAERAVRAGLDVIRAISSLPVPSDRQLAVRIGIATGLVVVGEMLSEGQPQEPMVSGETPNLAARLQQHTPPGTILVAQETRRILGNAFLFEPVELGPAKGFETGLEAFRVMGEALGASRFEKRHGAAIPAIVGRNQEIDLLLARWKQAKGGEGQGVLLVGEPGIGKSRILRALIDELRGEPHQRIDAQCSPYYLDRPLWPIVEHLRTAFDIRPSQPVTEQLGAARAISSRPWRCAGRRLFLSMPSCSTYLTRRRMPTWLYPRSRSAFGHCRFSTANFFRLLAASRRCSSWKMLIGWTQPPSNCWRSFSKALRTRPSWWSSRAGRKIRPTFQPIRM